MSELLHYELSLPIAQDAELVAAGAIEKLALSEGFGQRAMEQVRIAVIEACINAFEHSDSPDRRVHLTFVTETDRLLVIVRDFGKGFDPATIEPPCLQDKLKGHHKRGWGLKFIREFMDLVEFRDLCPGTELRMTKYLTHPATERPPHEETHD